MAQFATTSVFIDKYHPQKDGKCAVSIRITHQRKKKYYPTIHSLTVADFEKVKSSERPREEIKQIRQQLQALEKRAADIIRELPYFTWEGFERLFLQNRGNRHELKTAFDTYIKALREENRIGTAVSYECAKRSLLSFKVDAVLMDVTPSFLSRYEKWMLESGNSVTTIGIYLRSLRTLLNIAIEEGVISKELYPFGKRRYEIPTGNNIKKALSLSEIAAIYRYQPEQVNQERMKDYWMFMYYCNGINVKDMCLLRYKNLQDDMLFFERAKTARTKRKIEPIRVALLDEAKQIIDKWGNKNEGKDTFVFPILSEGLSPDRERQLIQQLTHVINDNMKTMAKAIGIKGEVTTYAARHSFATVLKRSGASTEFISEALGHSNVKTTQNYLASFEDERKKEMAKALTAFG